MIIMKRTLLLIAFFSILYLFAANFSGINNSVFAQDTTESFSSAPDTVTTEDPGDVFFEPVEDEEEAVSEKSSLTTYLIIGGIAVVVVILVIVFIKRGSKGKTEQTEG